MTFTIYQYLDANTHILKAYIQYVKPMLGYNNKIWLGQKHI